MGWGALSAAPEGSRGDALSLLGDDSTRNIKIVKIVCAMQVPSTRCCISLALIRKRVGDVRGPVSRVLWPPLGGRRSFLWDRPRGRPRTTYPEGQGAGHRQPSLFGLSPGGVCPASPVTRTAVRSYRTISPLPAGKRVSSQAVSFLWHFPWPRGRLPLATTLTRGARTFLPGETPERSSRPLTSERMVSLQPEARVARGM